MRCDATLCILPTKMYINVYKMTNNDDGGGPKLHRFDTSLFVAMLAV